MKLKVDGALVGTGDLDEAFLATWTQLDTPWDSPKLTGGWGRGWPGSTNTGPMAAPDWPGSLTPHDGSPIISNTTYAFVSFEGLEVGSADNPVHGVHFHGCSIRDTAVNVAVLKNYTDGPAAFTYCESAPPVDFDPTTQVPFDQSIEFTFSTDGAFGTFNDWLLIDSCDFWGFCVGITLGNSAPGSVDPPVYIRHNWIHDASDDGAELNGGVAIYHTDGIGHTTALGHLANILIEHNVVDSIGNTNGLAMQGPNPPVTYSDLTVRQNLWSGFGFTIAITDPAGENIVFEDNWLSTRLRPFFGPLYGNVVPFDANGNSWARNRLWVPPDASWGDPEHHGLYWVPTPGLDLRDNGYDSGSITSETDYTP